MAFQKKISTMGLLASSVVGMVGSGWLLGPLAAAKIAGPGAIFSWVLAGLLMMVVASTFVTLSTKFPTPGGGVRFFQLSYGHFAGFSFSWVAWLGWVAVTPIEAMASIQYVSHFVPSLMTSAPVPVLTHLGLAVAIAIIIILSFLNNFGVETYSRLNQLMLLIKISIPILTVIFLIHHASMNISHWQAFGPMMPFGLKGVLKALPVAGVIYCFIGFNPAVQMSAEVEKKHAISVAIYGSLIICIMLYTAIQVGFLFALPQSAFSNGWHALHFLGDIAPFVGLLTMVGLLFFVKFLYLDAVVSPLGTAFTQSMATSRMTYAMAENGYFPEFLKILNPKGSPVYAILCNAVVGVIFFMPFPSWQHMVGFLSSALVLGYVVGPMSLVVLSKDVSSRLFSPLNNILLHLRCLAAFYICSLIIYWSGWSVVSQILFIFFIGKILLALMCGFSPSMRAKINKASVLRGIWVVIYMLALSVISYFGSFGGTGRITFGWDFIALFGMAVVIFMIAKCCVYYTEPLQWQGKA